MVKFCCLLALCQLGEARRLQPAATVLAKDAGQRGQGLPAWVDSATSALSAWVGSSDSYLCRDGQGQPGQNFATLQGSKADCRGKCDADATCMGFEFFAGSAGWWEPPCKLFGANVPQLGAANRTQYCLRETFASVQAEAVPGDGKFVPKLGWLAETLQVPVSSADCKQLGSGGNKGMSGAQFFKCNVEYGGSQNFPSLGLPTELFVKIRMPKQDPDEFGVERQVYALTNHLPEKPPLPLLLSGCRNHLLQQSAGSGVDPDHAFSDAEVKALLDAYAKLHSGFWGISSTGLKLKSQQTWGQVFAPVSAFNASDVASFLPATKLPSDVQQLIIRLGKEVGYDKALQYMRSGGQTLVQGDAHNGQVLKGPDDGSAGGTWMLADFGWAHADHPAVDIGALLPQISSKENHEKYVKYYWQKFTDSVGCDKDGSGELPSCDYTDFFMLVKLGAFYRGTFILSMYGAAANDPANPNPDFWENPKVQHNLLLWLGVLDSETVDYLSNKTEGISSSLLSISELPAPDQKVLDTLRVREISVLHTLPVVEF